MEIDVTVHAPLTTRPTKRPAISNLPPLDAGDRLTRAEFHRRYSLRSDINKAELIEGIVHMPAPVRFESHSEPHSFVITWLGVYCAATPGIRLGDNATVILDADNEVQPDGLLRVDESLGGRSFLNKNDYVAGPPELVVEVAASSAAYDLHAKRHVYRRSGVQEYLVLQAYEQRTVWFMLEEGEYQPSTAGADGVLRSQVFAGLWLKQEAVWSGDLAGLLAVLQEGLASEDHQRFVAELRTRSEQRS